MKINENDLNLLRERVEKILSKKRFLHTVSVEKCAQRLAVALEVTDVSIVRAAALLHDITKELDFSEHLELLRGVNLAEEDLEAPAILHSFSAPFVILRDFPEYSDERILSAVKNHTTGDDGMSLTDLIIFIADYAEQTRTNQSCITVNKFLFDNLEALTKTERLERLYKACLMAIGFTKEYLSASGGRINQRTDRCEKFLKEKILLL
ncbi:MAG: bis(5'-nucleosyl)-tetraphosphatase (symmetrical) YqeK [Clostridia bacterium]|nr:bis(5'-nucleosyl)-tetraphosphatase (symmetrical) YqeK [Clostridia bacterium]